MGIPWKCDFWFFRKCFFYSRFENKGIGRTGCTGVLARAVATGWNVALGWSHREKSKSGKSENFTQCKLFKSNVQYDSRCSEQSKTQNWALVFHRDWTSKHVFNFVSWRPQLFALWFTAGFCWGFGEGVSSRVFAFENAKPWGLLPGSGNMRWVGRVCLLYLQAKQNLQNFYSYNLHIKSGKVSFIRSQLCAGPLFGFAFWSGCNSNFPRFEKWNINYFFYPPFSNLELWFGSSPLLFCFLVPFPSSWNFTEHWKYTFPKNTPSFHRDHPLQKYGISVPSSAAPLSRWPSARSVELRKVSIPGC